jgi:hypothetical protein
MRFLFLFLFSIAAASEMNVEFLAGQGLAKRTLTNLQVR